MRRFRQFIITVFILSAGFAGQIHAETGFDPGFSGIKIKINRLTIPYREFGIFLLPSEIVSIEIVRSDDDQQTIYLVDSDRIVKNGGFNRWSWQAPVEKGSYQLLFLDKDGALKTKLNIFVMIPFYKAAKGYLNGYKIGVYPEISFDEQGSYKLPAGFIEVTESNRQVLIAPHFRLEQFLCKQDSHFPKYVVLKEQLLLKLELILQAVNREGYACSGLEIMSGYRTPYYNELIGNVKYSFHVWGGAADIFIDETPKDGLMDDLNRDGAINYLDAGILFDIVDEMHKAFPEKELVGGLARYKRSQVHGPFIHVDVRGFRARWGP